MSTSLPAKTCSIHWKAFASMYRRKSRAATDILGIAYGSIVIAFRVVPSYQDLSNKSPSVGTNFLTVNLIGSGQSPRVTLIVLVSVFAHTDISVIFMTGHRFVFNRPPARKSTLSLSL